MTSHIAMRHEPPTVIAGRIWHQAREKLPGPTQRCLFWFWGDWRNLFLGTWDDRESCAYTVGAYYEGRVRVTCGQRRDWWWTLVTKEA